MTGTTGPLALVAARNADDARLGLSRDQIPQREDGARTDGRESTYERRYADAHLDDGAQIVVVFMNELLDAPQQPLTPTIRLGPVPPDGRSFDKIVHHPDGSWSAATDHPESGHRDDAVRPEPRPRALLAAAGAAGRRDRDLQHRRGLDQHHRHRPPRPQPGQRWPARHRARLVPGARPGRPDLGDHLGHHRGREVRLRPDPDRHAGPGRADRGRRLRPGDLRDRGRLHRRPHRQAGRGHHPLHR